MRTSPSERRAVRWLRAVAIIAAAAAALAWIWMSGGERTSQERVHLSAATMMGTLVLLAAWLLMFSGLSRSVRRRVAVAVVAVAVLGAATIRIRGVTGDLDPDPGVAMGVGREAGVERFAADGRNPCSAGECAGCARRGARPGAERRRAAASGYKDARHCTGARRERLLCAVPRSESRRCRRGRASRHGLDGGAAAAGVAAASRRRLVRLRDRRRHRRHAGAARRQGDGRRLPAGRRAAGVVARRRCAL